MAGPVARSPSVALSNAIIQIYKEGYGKGATRTRIRMTDDVIVVELEDIFTRVEHTLIAAGHRDQVRKTRDIFRQAHHARFIGSVEELTGRKVRAYLSQVHFQPDIGVELFLLEPQDAAA